MKVFHICLDENQSIGLNISSMKSGLRKTKPIFQAIILSVINKSIFVTRWGEIVSYIIHSPCISFLIPLTTRNFAYEPRGTIQSDDFIEFLKKIYYFITTAVDEKFFQRERNWKNKEFINIICESIFIIKFSVPIFF